eukprot:s3208_g4.t1
MCLPGRCRAGVSRSSAAAALLALQTSGFSAAVRANRRAACASRGLLSEVVSRDHFSPDRNILVMPAEKCQSVLSSPVVTMYVDKRAATAVVVSRGFGL